MYSLLSGLLSDKVGGEVFTCFSLWHWGFIILIIGITLWAILYLKDKSQDERDRIVKLFIHIAFGLYIADFFLMPFAYGEIDVDKLPFHSCTAMCVMCFCSHHNRLLEKYRLHFALLGFISNLIYIIYPAGIMWYEIHPLSYRAVQTLLFHGMMVVHCLLALLFDKQKPEWRTCYKNLILLVVMTFWAILGNALYSGEGEDYSRSFNWFFVRQDPLDVLPAHIAPYVSPVLNIAAFFAVEMLIYLIYDLVKKRLAAKAAPKKV